jgi:hypothetical protein
MERLLQTTHPPENNHTRTKHESNCVKSSVMTAARAARTGAAKVLERREQHRGKLYSCALSSPGICIHKLHVHRDNSGTPSREAATGVFLKFLIILNKHFNSLSAGRQNFEIRKEN